MHAIISTLIQELHAFAKDHHHAKAVVELSGTLDSTLVLTLAIRAFGAKNVTALVMPEMGVSSQLETERAKIIAEHFGCPMLYEPINNYLVDYQFVAWERSKTAFENLKARIRATLLSDFAECNEAMVLGTGNKTSLRLGIGSKDGAFFGDLHILGDLYKTDLIDLGRHIGLPQELGDEADPDGLWKKTDDILHQLDDKVDPESMIEKGMDSVLVHKVVRLSQENDLFYKNFPIIPIGRMSESIKKAQKAEAESMA